VTSVRPDHGVPVHWHLKRADCGRVRLISGARRDQAALISEPGYRATRSDPTAAAEHAVSGHLVQRRRLHPDVPAAATHPGTRRAHAAFVDLDCDCHPTMALPRSTPSSPLDSSSRQPVIRRSSSLRYRIPGWVGAPHIVRHAPLITVWRGVPNTAEPRRPGAERTRPHRAPQPSHPDRVTVRRRDPPLPYDSASLRVIMHRIVSVDSRRRPLTPHAVCCPIIHVYRLLDARRRYVRPLRYRRSAVGGYQIQFGQALASIRPYPVMARLPHASVSMQQDRRDRPRTRPGRSMPRLHRFVHERGRWLFASPPSRGGRRPRRARPPILD